MSDYSDYLVVRNDEDQYSIWFADRELPAGWHDEGVRGSREDCLAHIDQVWTDMRPRSVRLAMEGA
jgi:MbtH protein